MSRRLSFALESGPILYFYVLAAVILRLLPHPWNLAPVGAMFLFSAATFGNRWTGLAVPLIALMASDYAVIQVLYGGQYAWFSPFTWTAFLLVGVIGWALRPKTTTLRVAGAAIAGSLTFFLLSNLGVWLAGNLYPMTLAGLGQCFAAAIPFFRNDVAGNLIYSAVMFGSYQWIKARRRAVVTA